MSRRLSTTAIVLFVTSLSAGCGQSPAPREPDAAQVAGSTAASDSGTAKGETMRVVISGGDDAGTYTSSEDPLCSKDKVGPGGWNVNYMNIDLTGQKDFTGLHLTFFKGEPPKDGLYAGVEVWAIVKLGELMSPNSRELVFRVSPALGEGSGSATVENGARPVLRATGTTAKGIGLDITVHCIDTDGMP